MRTVFYIVVDAEDLTVIEDGKTEDIHAARALALALCEAHQREFYVMKLVGMSAPPAKQAEYLTVST